MNKNNWEYWAFILMIIGSLQFIVLTIIAMFFYKGGTYVDSSTSNYVFWYNYFSDLGRIKAHSGNQNTISAVIFIIALSFWGLFQIPFYIAFRKFFKNSRTSKKISMGGSFFGVITGVFYIGIAFTPLDLLGMFHEIFAFFGFGSAFLSNILYSAVIFHDKNFSNLYAKILLISTFILSIYFLTLLLIQNINTTTKLLIYVAGQKVMIYTLLICGIFLGFGAIRHKP
ncbi:MAG: hypothetical protein ACFFB8_08530 [Promethearchaeota archaeon]